MLHLKIGNETAILHDGQSDMWYVDAKIAEISEALLVALHDLDLKVNFTKQTGVDCLWREGDNGQWNSGRILGVTGDILTFRMMPTGAQQGDAP